MNLGFFLIVFGVFSSLVGIMAIGVIMGRRPISGSCWGIGQINGKDAECAICGDNPQRCVEAINDKSVVGIVTSRKSAGAEVKEGIPGL